MGIALAGIQIPGLSGLLVFIGSQVVDGAAADKFRMGTYLGFGKPGKVTG